MLGRRSIAGPPTAMQPLCRTRRPWAPIIRVHPYTVAGPDGSAPPARDVRLPGASGRATPVRSRVVMDGGPPRRGRCRHGPPEETGVPRDPKTASPDSVRRAAPARRPAGAHRPPRHRARPNGHAGRVARGRCPRDRGGPPRRTGGRDGDQPADRGRHGDGDRTATGRVRHRVHHRRRRPHRHQLARRHRRRAIRGDLRRRRTRARPTWSAPTRSATSPSSGSRATCRRSCRSATPTRSEPGQPVLAIGSPLGAFTNTVTQGIVSAIGRNFPLSGGQGPSVYTNLIQHDAAINPGNSGGPLFNLAGEVVGVNTLGIPTAGERPAGAGALLRDPGQHGPADHRPDLIENGEVVYPYFGIGPVAVTREVAAQAGSADRLRRLRRPGQSRTARRRRPASRRATSILAIDGQRIDEQNSFAEVLFAHRPGRHGRGRRSSATATNRPSRSPSASARRRKTETAAAAVRRRRRRGPFPAAGSRRPARSCARRSSDRPSGRSSTGAPAR